MMKNKSTLFKKFFSKTSRMAARALSAVAVVVMSLSALAQQTVKLEYNGDAAKEWAVPNCVTSITVQAWGAGGGYRISNGTSGGYGNSGGGGGAYETAVYTVLPGQILTYTIGKGGSGGAKTFTNGLNDKDGKSTTIASLTAQGGKGANNETVENNVYPYGNGGEATTSGRSGGKGGSAGKINGVATDYGGGGGGAGYPFVNAANNGNGGSGAIRDGGRSSIADLLGGKGGDGGTSNSNSGKLGVGFGGGGGGGLKFTTGSPIGGDGAHGAIIITYTLNTAPTATVTTTSGNACAGQNVVFTINSTVGTVVKYNLNGDIAQSVTIPASGSEKVTVIGATTSQTLNLISVSINGCVTVLTGNAIKAVTPLSVGGTISGGASLICKGSLTGPLTLSDYTGTIVQWERQLNGGGWNSLGNGGKATFSEVPSADGTYTYRVLVQNGSCTAAYSSIKTIEVSPTTKPGTVYGGNSQICLNSSTGNMTLGGDLQGSVVSWEKKLSSASFWTAIPNTSLSYSENPSVAGTWQYRAVVKSGICDELRSGLFQVVVNPELTISLVSANSFACTTATSSTLSYTSTTGNANRVKIDFNNVANAAGVQDLDFGVSAGPGTITIQYAGTTLPGIYYGVLTVVKDYPSCTSITTYPVTLTINGSISKTPPVAKITQPNCALLNPGSVVLSGLPATGTIVQTGYVNASYTIAGGGSQTIIGLAAGTYDFVISNGCSTSNKANVVINPVSNTWNGTSWSNAGKIPTIDQAVIFNGDYNTSSGNITACNCQIQNGKTLTIGTGTSAIIQNDITNNGSIVVESDGNLIQNNDDGVYIAGTSATFNVKRNSNLKRLDYTYWASPVKNQNLKVFSPGTVNTRFYTYNEGNDLFDSIDPVANIFGNKEGVFESAAKGYAIRADNNYPAATNTIPAPMQLFKGVFKGVPNNGVVTFPLKFKTVDPKTPSLIGYGYNLVGNPYASNIDFKELYTDNKTVIDGTAYFWTNLNPNPAMQGSGYPGEGYFNNYATLNQSGGIPATQGKTTTMSDIPTYIIKVGQGFLVKATKTGNLTFKNSVRKADVNSIFFNKGTTENTESTVDRYWLHLTTPLNVVTTALIAYVDQATDGYESSYDADLLGLGSDALFTQLGEHKLGIQGRQYPLNRADVVALGTNHYDGGTYTMSLGDKEGVFANGQNIYLKDKQTGIVTNLSEGTYTFAANKGLTEGRFEILYQPEIVLAAGGNLKDELVIYRDGNDFVIKSSIKNITGLEVYDASGKLIITLKQNQKENRIDATTFSNGIYILKINRSGHITSKKIIK